MKILDFQSQYAPPIALALGFFDCIHLGHRALIRAAQEFSKRNNIESALFTFANDMSAFFGREPQIYTFDERIQTLSALNLDNVIAAKFDRDFMELSAEEFFDILNERFNVKAIFVGEDYTFGRGATGDVKMLRKLCAESEIDLCEMPFELYDGNKISTSYLKELVKRGEVEPLNKLLGEPYMILGKISSNRHMGKSLGFPTANIPVYANKLTLKDGIYATTLTVAGKTYNAMTNVGAKPTFNDYTPTIESYIFDFDGDIYGKEATIRAYARTRDIVKFDSTDELKEQLRRDEAQIRNILAGLTK